MGDSYAEIFLQSSLAGEGPFSALMLLLLFMARILPIIGQSPFFGARILPNPVKICFAISLFVIFLPKLLEVTTTRDINFNTWALILFGKEVFVGYLLGFFISMPFSIVQTVGMIIDHQRGGASLMVNDPTIQNQSSPLGTLFNMVMIIIFFYIDGPFLFIEALLNSYDVIPPDQLINPNFFREDSAFWKTEMQLLNQVMIISIRLASPALVAVLMTDLFLGIINRLAPQVQITFLGMPLKSLLALGVITLGWKAFAMQLSTEAFYWLNQIKNILIMFKQGVL